MAPQRDKRVKFSALLRAGHNVSKVEYYIQTVGIQRSKISSCLIFFTIDRMRYKPSANYRPISMSRTLYSIYFWQIGKYISLNLYLNIKLTRPIN